MLPFLFPYFEKGISKFFSQFLSKKSAVTWHMDKGFIHSNKNLLIFWWVLLPFKLGKQVQRQCDSFSYCRGHHLHPSPSFPVELCVIFFWEGNAKLKWITMECQCPLSTVLSHGISALAADNGKLIWYFTFCFILEYMLSSLSSMMKIWHVQ